MIEHNAGLTDSHPYATGPINWPFLLSGISFWTTKTKDREQVYLIGNVVDWWFCVLTLSVFVGILGAEQLARRRGISAIPESEAEQSYPGSPMWTDVALPLSLRRREEQTVQHRRLLPCRLVLPLRTILDNESAAIPTPVRSRPTRQKDSLS